MFPIAQGRLPAWDTQAGEGDVDLNLSSELQSRHGTELLISDPGQKPRPQFSLGAGEDHPPD